MNIKFDFFLFIFLFFSSYISSHTLNELVDIAQGFIEHFTVPTNNIYTTTFGAYELEVINLIPTFTYSDITYQEGNNCFFRYENVTISYIFNIIITVNDEIKIFKQEYLTLVLYYKSITFYSQTDYIFDFLRPIFALSTIYKSDLLSYDFINTSFDLKEFASLFQNDLEFHIEQLLVIYPNSLCPRAFEVTIDKVTKYGEFPVSSVSEYDIHYGKISSMTYSTVEKVGVYRKFNDIEIRLSYKTKKGYMVFNTSISYILATSLSLSFGEFKKISTVGVLIIQEMLNKVYNSIINKS